MTDSYQGENPTDVVEGTLRLTEGQCWLIQTAIRPGLTGSDGVPNSKAQFVAYGLRGKVNDAILRFADETGLERLEITVNEDDCWLLDFSIPFDGRGGAGMDMLTQCFRILWGIKYQLPPELAAEPEPVAAAEGEGDTKVEGEAPDVTTSGEMNPFTAGL